MLLCDRPHSKTVDFARERFVVSKECGVRCAGQKFELGDEIPSGALNQNALREIYEPPLSKIETASFARRLPYLREACARRGVELEEVEKTVSEPETGDRLEASRPEKEPEKVLPNVEDMDKRELVELCKSLRLNLHGNAPVLRARILAHLA